MLSVGDRVIVTKGEVSDENAVGEIGTIIEIDETNWIPYLIEFDNDLNGHSGGGKGKINHCWWCTTEEWGEEKDVDIDRECVIALYYEFLIDLNPVNPVNDYSRTCWHCQQGGIVDRLAFAADAILLCPVCSRVCNGRKVE